MLVLEIKIKIIRKKRIFIAHNRWMLSKYLSIFLNLSKIFLCKYYPIDLSIFKPRKKIN